MSINSESSHHYRCESRRGIFFPLLLVAVGVLFLLGTLGVIPGGSGAGFIKYWPILLIIIGLDGFYRHDGGYVGAALMLGLGIIFLLGNLGYLEVTPWQVVLQFWPVLLVAAGLDLIVGRRSFWSLIVGVALGAGLVVGIFWLGLASPLNAAPVQQIPFSQVMQGEKSAKLNLEPIAGALNVSAGAESSFLLQGTLSSARQEEVRQSFLLEGDQSIYRLEGPKQQVYPFFVWGRTSPYRWDVNLTSAIPLDLNTRVVVGSQVLETDGLRLSALQTETVMGETRITLSETDRLDAETNGVFGRLLLQVPKGLKLHIVEDCAVCSVQLPSDFQREGDDIWAPGARGESQVNLRVELVFGTLEVAYLP